MVTYVRRCICSNHLSILFLRVSLSLLSLDLWAQGNHSFLVLVLSSMVITIGFSASAHDPSLISILCLVVGPNLVLLYDDGMIMARYI
jgi:hypothetical protein